MSAYDYEIAVHTDHYSDQHTYFIVYDRRRGRDWHIAECSDRADAELIVRALIALETPAQPSNHNTIETPMEIAA